MDLQRTLLIVGLAVVSYLMILQWQEDYGAKTPPTQAQINSQSYPQANVGQSPVHNAASEDVPTALESDVVDVKPSTDSFQPTLSPIRVVTDVLELTIDPVGGDIIAVDLLDYAYSVDAPEIPFSLLAKNNLHTYVAQSGLTGADGPDASKAGRPRYNSIQTQYDLGQEAELVVDLSFTQATGVEIIKRFTFKRGEYLVDVQYLIENNSNSAWRGALYGQIKRDGTPDPGLQDSTGFGLPTYLGAAYWSSDQPYNKISFEDIDDQTMEKKISGGWLAMIQHYFMSAWVPDQSFAHIYRAWKVSGGYIIGFTSPIVNIAAGESGELSARFYAGPKVLSKLEDIEGAEGIDLAVDYGPLFFISKPLFLMLDIFHSFSNNWGVAIILLTVLIKLIFFPLSAASYRSMANMRRVQPKLISMRERFGDDRQKMSQEMMKLYKEEKINPLGGCLPILVQMPVFLALYWALLESVELRQAPFFGWIVDLSVMDPFFVLPLLMGATMFIQQLLNPAPPDPMQARMMKMMPIIFTVFFLWFPAGLVLYWVTNNVLSIAQQWYITRSIEAGGK